MKACLHCLIMVGFLGMMFAGLCLADEKAFDLSDVAVKAEALAKAPYQNEYLNLTEELAKLTPENYARIRFLAEKGPWYNKGLDYQIHFYHPGGLFNHPVRINEIVDGKASEVAYDYRNFDFGGSGIAADKFEKDIGYAGFRLNYLLNNNDNFDELISFLGASYFRSMGKGERYGLSARGLALNTAEATVEEFPVFKEFWIERPEKNNSKVRIYALLDSESVTGAYAFRVNAGEVTTVDVEAILFPRKDIAKLGIAPLTSMFLYGENTRFRFDDYRPEVHDSDGLLLINGNGEKIWRPLDNSQHLRLSSFVDENPQGFGLQQRDRNPRNYLDPEAMYELRPSMWIEPKGTWGKGKIQLAELPSINETNDNVVAYWVPDEPIKAGGRYEYKYRLNWGDETKNMDNLAKVMATHSGLGGDGLAGEYIKDRRKFVIDFSGFEDKKLQQDIENGTIWADISNQAGAISNISLMYTPSINGATLHFDFEPNREIVELRVLLRNKAEDNRIISEIWSYQWWK